jgi:hypothetical protein
MMKTTPLRRTIRHLAQRLRMDGDTFMKFSLHGAVSSTAKTLIILFVLESVYIFTGFRRVIRQSGVEVLLR